MAIDGVGRPTKQQADDKKRLNAYQECIAAYERTFKSWESRCDRIIKRYRDDRTASDGKLCRFNIMWANVQILVPATFSRLPQPDVSRRFRDNDPVGRVASLILERALDYEIEHYPDYRATLSQSVQDRFLGGRATAWARYEPHIRATQQNLPTDGAEITEDADEPDEELDYECAPIDYVHWKDFGHQVARTWEEVTKVWRNVYLTHDACVARFGKELGNKIPVDTTPSDMKKELAESADYARAKITELWDKERMQAVWIHAQLGFLDQRDDPLNLEGFFPCPRPLYATLTNESLIPVPDFALYQDQARELDTLADRIDGLVRALQVKGMYDSAIPELARLFTEGSNTDMIPVKNWAAFSEKNGLKGAIDLIDLKNIADALKEAYLAMEQIKGQVYEITGVADITRGQSDPNETLGAQQLKANYAGLRLKSYQSEVALFATEALRLKAQIMCGKFDPQTLIKMSAAEQLNPADQQYLQPAMELLIGERLQNPEARAENPLRSFRIDIAADTLVQLDEEAEKASRVEFLTAVGTYMEKAMPIVQAVPDAGGVVIDLLKFGVTGFKVGKQIEGALDEALDKMRAAAAQPKPPPPDPAMAKVQAAAAHAQAQQQIDAKHAADDLQLTHQREQAKLITDAQAEQGRQQLEREKIAGQLANDRAKGMAEIALKRELGHRQVDVSKETEFTKIDAQKDTQEHEQKVLEADNMNVEGVKKLIEESTKSNMETQKSMQDAMKELKDLATTIAQAAKDNARLRRRVPVRDPNGRITHADEQYLN